MSALVAVVTPVYREEATPEEKISLSRLRKILNRWPQYTCAPAGMPALPGAAGVKHFPVSCFSSVDAYSRLLLSRPFYEAFQDYEFILVYQADCLVFSDDLESWCRTGYDYVGAPWMKNPDHPEFGFSRVGNGGLSLRRIPAFLRVIDSQVVPGLSGVLRARFPELSGMTPFAKARKKVRLLREMQRGSAWYREHYSLNEDRFWSDRARFFSPGFRVAPVAEGLRFSFERAPQYSLIQNDGKLPFGCHAWSRYGRDFWQAYLRN